MEKEIMKADVYVDGSYNKMTDTVGAAYIMILENGEKVYFSAKYNSKVNSYHNVAGELLATFEAFKTARKHNVSELTVYYDYSGIEAWATGKWKAKNSFTKWYVNQCCIAFEYMNIIFKKVKAHSGDNMNDVADNMAKKVCGVLHE